MNLICLTLLNLCLKPSDFLLDLSQLHDQHGLLVSLLLEISLKLHQILRLLLYLHLSLNKLLSHALVVELESLHLKLLNLFLAHFNLNLYLLFILNNLGLLLLVHD